METNHSGQAAQAWESGDSGYASGGEMEFFCPLLGPRVVCVSACVCFRIRRLSSCLYLGPFDGPFPTPGLSWMRLFILSWNIHVVPGKVSKENEFHSPHPHFPLFFPSASGAAPGGTEGGISMLGQCGVIGKLNVGFILC